eukprot:12240026-Prorocentrum_lima.AAC.1
MGFHKEARPQAMVGDHILRELCAHDRLFREQWEDLHGSEHFARSYTASALYTCKEATGGGIFEISAACHAYFLQVIICVRQVDRFIVVGAEGRRTLTLSYDRGQWDLIAYRV